MPNSNTMNIGLVGYGRMGQVIERILIERGHHISFIVDPNNSQASVTSLIELGSALQKADIIIDFSFPEAVLGNIASYSDKKVSAVIGTTGWNADIDKVSRLVDEGGIGLVHGGNFSIGAHLFMRISRDTAKFLNKIQEYDVALWESHHNKKKDRPSGTALMTAELVLKEIDRKKELCFDLPLDTPVSPEMLPVVSQRVGSEIGFHEMIADSTFDSIKISHHARSREGFALGAILSAEWLHHSKRRGLITVHEFIDELLA